MPRSLLNSIFDTVETDATILNDGTFIKFEGQQLSGTVKYRMVSNKVERALQNNLIHSKQTLVEVTAGSTGVALASFGYRAGYSTEIHAYDNIDASKARAIEEHGGKLVLYDPEIPFPQLVSIVLGLAKSDDYWHLNQMDRQTNIESYRNLGLELVQQINDQMTRPPTRFVCPVGTGGVIQGVGTVLKEHFPDIQIISIEPAEGMHIDGLRNTQLIHMGDQDPYDRDFPDMRIEVGDETSGTIDKTLNIGHSARAALSIIRKNRWNDCIVIAAD